jgi:hypothetical protein
MISQKNIKKDLANLFFSFLPIPSAIFGAKK